MVCAGVCCSRSATGGPRCGGAAGGRSQRRQRRHPWRHLRRQEAGDQVPSCCSSSESCAKPTAALTFPTLDSMRPALLMSADVGGEQMPCSWSPDAQTAPAAHAGLGHRRRCADCACCALSKSIAHCQARTSGIQLFQLQVARGAAAACQGCGAAAAAATAAASPHAAAEARVSGQAAVARRC